MFLANETGFTLGQGGVETCTMYNNRTTNQFMLMCVLVDPNTTSLLHTGTGIIPMWVIMKQVTPCIPLVMLFFDLSRRAEIDVNEADLMIDVRYFHAGSSK